MSYSKQGSPLWTIIGAIIAFLALIWAVFIWVFPNPQTLLNQKTSLSHPPLPTERITPLVSGLDGAIGAEYNPSEDQLYFLEYGGKLSVLENASSLRPNYRVLGMGYDRPQDLHLSKDKRTAYITERGGNLLRVSLATPNRSQATVIATELAAPQQLFLDEDRGFAYTVEFAQPGHLWRIHLTTGQKTALRSDLQQAIGLTMSADVNTAYITEQRDNGIGQLTRFDLLTGTRTVLATSSIAPLFQLSWADTEHKALLMTEREPANKIWLLDLTRSPQILELVAIVSFNPNRVVRISNNLFPMLVCSKEMISRLD